MKYNRDILFINDFSDYSDHPSHRLNERLKELQSALSALGYQFTVVDSLPQATAMVAETPHFGGVGLFWSGKESDGADALHFLTTFRARNPETPIFLLSVESITHNLPIDLLKEMKEYIYLYSETPPFLANRIDRAIRRHYEAMLPPYFKTLKEFTEDGDYYWDCPGHMGGMAYLKHPVGAEFFKFYGENMFRSDIGVATAEMGDYLIHEGPPKKSEAIAAKEFGADWTFYGVGGSSTSNRIVAQGAVGANEMVAVDRNCHKSINHALTLSQARPVYLQPTRNGFGLIGPIPTKRLTKDHIDSLIAASPLTKDAISPAPTYAVVTNCTYDGFCYNVKDVVSHLGESVPRIHFDEAWYAYAKFHPLYKARFAMDVEDNDPHRPTIFAVQSTHKMLPALSMASMIHVKKSERAPLNFEDFNDAFMMHGTTSPYYPIIASIDVAVNMMSGQSGYSLVQESLEEAIAFRKSIVSIKRRLQEEEGEESWFFDLLQPREIYSEKENRHYSFEEAPIELLTHDPRAWQLRAGEDWHGFSDEDLADTDSMLDPVKVTITCPGITAQGIYEERGIPGYIMTRFLDDRRIEIARTGDYTLLILFSVGTTKGKWGTLVEALLEFKKLYDNDTLAIEAIPSLAAEGDHYRNITLKALCQKMHEMMKSKEMMLKINNAVNSAPIAELTPAEAFQKVVRYQTEVVKLDDFRGRISATMVTPYPPGIPVLMPGERLSEEDTGVIAYLKALQEFDKAFPGFEHELQGVHIDEAGDFWVRAIVEEEREPAQPKVKFRKQRSHAIRTARG